MYRLFDKKPFYSISAITFLVGLLFLGTGCANKQPPPGGPRDEQPPIILGTFPEQNALNVAPDQSVVIQFNESIRRESVSQAFSLSPPPTGNVRARWKGRQLTLVFEEPLLDDRTYVLTLGTQLSDNRGNKLENSYHLSFSTGDQLDQGQIRGILVKRGDGSVQGWNVVGYLIEDGQAGTPGGSDGMHEPDPSTDLPDAATQAGANGTWELRNLKSGTWRIFAFNDRDGDRLWSPGLDAVGVPPYDVVVTQDSSNIQTITLVGAARPTLPMPVRFTARTRELFLLRFDRPVPALECDLSIFTFDANDTGESSDTVQQEDLRTGRHAVRDIYYDPADSSLLRLHLAYPADGDSARIRIAGSFGVADTMDTTITASMERTSDIDTLRPGVVRIDPVEMMRIHPNSGDFYLTFNEEMDESMQGAFYYLNGQDTLLSDYEQMSPFTVRLPLDSEYVNGSFTVRIFGDSLRDIAGNTLQDSLINYRYFYLSPDSSGSLSGEIQYSQDLPVHLTLSSLSERDGDLQQMRTGGGPFEFLQVPAGHWRMFAWVDRNRDNEFSPGEPYPFFPAELFKVQPDTIFVRARWESGGVILTLP